MYSLSVIILSYAIDDDIYKMNCRCVQSLLESESWIDDYLSIILIESNQQSRYKYNEKVKVIIPCEVFNFHRFLNIGIQKTNSDFIALCNNDIVFSKNWFSQILKVKESHASFMCFSPIDRDYKTMSYDLFPETKNYYIGWKNKYHFAAWCFVLDRRIFDIIGLLDETFDFYSCDDDFLMTLRKYALDNVLVTKSHVKHLSQVVTKKEDAINSHKITDKNKYPLTEKEIRRGLSWLWDDLRFYMAYRRMEKKWGNERMIRRINRLLYNFPFLRIRPITTILYSKNINDILVKICRI